jgi:hypothetical protein
VTERDLSDQPSTDHEPATDAPVVAGAGLTFDALDSTTPLTAGSGQDEVSDADDADRSADE